ncbi:hypothetical protein TNIN_94591 [Trichonephila inaurata madagascariensis]|uniref:Uncharacterized protein n=1 Tax=Trichonephila inaurata madagascariensis TaxID=2747483 RepID=A0A8X6YLV2_9ARAC|nr:hypothetical protein TNIN_94591 [Trichonephila inaurata madagascariensis]
MGPRNEKCEQLLKWSEHSNPEKTGLREDTKQGKNEERLIKIEDNPIEKPQSQEDLSDSETDSEDAESTSDRQLRNLSLLQKPKRFEDHIMQTESYLDDYNPET